MIVLNFDHKFIFTSVFLRKAELPPISIAHLLLHRNNMFFAEKPAFAVIQMHLIQMHLMFS